MWLTVSVANVAWQHPAGLAAECPAVARIGGALPTRRALVLVRPLPYPFKGYLYLFPLD